MKVDPLASTYCCHAQESFGPVDRAGVVAVVNEWISETFEAGIGVFPLIFEMRTAGEGSPTASLHGLGAVEGMRVDDVSSAIGVEVFDRTLFKYFNARRFSDPREITVVVARNMIGLIYSHMFGDETVFMPKSERLFLALSGLDPALGPRSPAVRRLSKRRIVAAGLLMASTNPLIAATSLRRILSGTSMFQREVVSRRASGNAISSSAVSTEPVRGWWLSVRLVAAPGTRVPSVYFYCAVLAALECGPDVTHHVVVDLRSGSPLLARTGGNAFSHIPFRADWTASSPLEVASQVRSRIRSGEALVRRAAGELVGRRNSRSRADPDGVASPMVLATTMSCFRVPGDRDHAFSGGDLAFARGMQTLEPAVLASNMRTTGRYADCTYSHSGNFVDLEKMRSAVNAAAAYLGLRIAVNTGSHFD